MSEQSATLELSDTPRFLDSVRNCLVVLLRRMSHMANNGHMTISPNAGAIPPMNTLPNRLRVARDYAGLSQTELSQRAELSRTTISAAEAGLKTPARATITVWAFACGVDVEWLRTGHEKTPSPDGDGVAVRHEGFEPPTFCLGVGESVTSGDVIGLRPSIKPLVA